MLMTSRRKIDKKNVFVLPISLSVLLWNVILMYITPMPPTFLASAWIPPSTQTILRQYQPTFQSSSATTTTTTTRHNVIFTRLSEDCLAALGSAQDQAFLLKQSQVDEGCMLAGICQHPGQVAITLHKFHITYDKVSDALQHLQPTASSQTTTKIPKLSDFRKQQQQDHQRELPLATTLQQTLFDAGSLSSSMGATAIEPHHVFLALLQYHEESTTGEAQAATRSDDCDVMELLNHLDATLEGQDICIFLLQSLLQKQQQQQNEQQQVTETETETEPTAKNEESSTILKSNNNASISSSTSPLSSTTTSQTKQDIVSTADSGAAMSDAKEKARSLLQECGIDLTRMAKEQQLDIVHGRTAELQACIQTLVRRRKNNVCLIGEAGVGKTCIIEALAQIVVSEQCPPSLQGHRIISLEVGALLAGTKFRGEFEERLRTIIDILTNSRTKSILFIDEIHNLVGAGGNSEGNMDASNILKPYLARGQLQVIGATTITEYQRYIAKDAALERRFQPLLIREPTVEETVDILQAVLPFYRGHHRVEYTPASLEAAARLSDRYINDRFLPDKAIDVLDEAGAMATLTRNRTDTELPTVTDKSITDIISQWTNIPVGRLEMDETDRLQLLEDNLRKRVKGQERAVRTVAKAIRRARTGIRNPRRPVASFLFCGPTGTGKTELCKALADTYYGSERDLIRIDMSEYMEKSSITRLTGPPPGLVGYEEGGQLTETVRRNPHSVVLLDELEKAHGDVLNLLLQVLEDGILTDGKGRTISFKNTVLIMTSNIGSKRILDLVQKHEEKNYGKTTSQKPTIESSNDDLFEPLERINYNKLARVVKRELESMMRPEFLNRIDDIVVFQPLTTNELSLIASIMVVDITSRAKLERDMTITVSPELLETMVHEGSGAASQFGARPMRRAIQRILEDAISDAVVKNFLLEGDNATFGKKEDNGESLGNEPLIVTVQREKDGQVLEIVIEESSRDLVSSAMVEDEDDDDSGLSFNGENQNDSMFLDSPLL